ncbi:MAG: hypothetical protein ACXWYT_11375 [Actinomycetota bacterium]
MTGDRQIRPPARWGRASANAMTTALFVSILAWQGAGPAAAKAIQASPRPDAWIKLCGLSTGCTIDPLPHPWRGDDVYNTSGSRQKIAVRLDDGEDVRFWLTLQNDAEREDTLVVKGCRGNNLFVIIAVKVGFLKRPDWRPPDITEGFKNGTATFDLPPASEGKRVPLTLAFIAPTTAEGVTYRCPITIRSRSDPSVSDTIVATMTTY